MRLPPRGAVRSALAGVLVATTLAGCAGHGWYAGDPPTRYMSAGQFVRTYLAAARAGDCDFTRRYTEKRALAWQLCSDPQVIAYRDLGEPEADDPDQPGAVDVSFDMLTDGSSDQTIPSGWYGSGLTVERTSHGWRVSDDGVA